MKLDRSHIASLRQTKGVLSTARSALLKKAEVPEVEAAAAQAGEALRRMWRAAAEEAIAEAAAEAQRRSDAAEQDLAASILGSLMWRLRMYSPPSGAAGRAARSIVRAARRDFGVPFETPLEELDHSTDGASDLAFWTSEFLKQRREKLEDVVTEWVKPLDEEHEPDVADLEDELAVVLEDAADKAVDFLALLWAYRLYNHTFALAAQKQGVTELELFNNPRGGGPDTRTTPFCRVNHLKRIPTARVAKQAEDYRAAVRAGRADQAQALFRMLTPEESSSTDERSAETILAGLGAPPYHARCRTTLRRPRTPVPQAEGP